MDAERKILAAAIGIHLPGVFGIEANATIGAHTDGETLVKPAVVAIAVQQLLAKVVQQFRTRQIELEGLIIQGEHKSGRLDGAQRGLIDSPREECVASLRPLGAIPGGQGSQVLLTFHGSGFALQDFLNLPAK